MNFFAELLALGVGFIWAVSGLISAYPVRVFGAFAFARVRQNVVVIVIGAALLFRDSFDLMSWEATALILCSGFIGIFLGDTALFAALDRLGPRRNAMIFALNAPITGILAVAVGKDEINFSEWVGVLLVLIGVLIAILYGKRRDLIHTWEQVRGPLWIGVGLSLTAALCQAVGLVLSDFVIDVAPANKPPVILVAALRVGIAAVALNALATFGWSAMQPASAPSTRAWFLACLSGVWGIGLGMTILVWAQSLGSEVGLISALSQTTPIWILPLIWIWTKERPATIAFVGAGIAVVGVFLIQLG